MSEQAVRIENWEVFTNPWKMQRYLHGEVYGHLRHPDGRIITTSAVTELREDVAMTKPGPSITLASKGTGMSMRPSRACLYDPARTG